MFSNHCPTNKYCLLTHCDTHYNQSCTVSFLIAWSSHNYLCGFVWIIYYISKTVQITLNMYLKFPTLGVFVFTVLGFSRLAGALGSLTLSEFLLCLFIYALMFHLFKKTQTNTPFPNLFSVTTCQMKTRPYLGNLYLMKENEEKH